jgi:hypothetical protein
MGLSMGPVVRVGLDVGIIPIGVIVDTGKVAFGFDTTMSMGIGWRPARLEGESKELFSGFSEGKPSDADNPFGIDIGLTGGGLFNVFLNRDNGNAFGLGFGGGYTTSFIDLLDGDRYYDNFANVPPLPKGVWYIRGAIIPNRRTKFTIYFDYYLRNLTTEIPPVSQFGKKDTGYIDSAYVYEYHVRHPRNWYGWGLGAYVKLY